MKRYARLAARNVRFLWVSVPRFFFMLNSPWGAGGRRKVICMKNIILILLFCAFLFSCSQEQESNKDKVVAVFVTGDEETSVNKVFGSKFVNAIVEGGKYKAVERTESFLDELGREQSFQRTGEVSDSKISEIGKLYGADMVCVIDITNVEIDHRKKTEKYIAAKLIDSETSEVLKVADVNENWEDLDGLSIVAEDLAVDLVGVNDSIKKVVDDRRRKNAEKPKELAIVLAKDRQEYEVMPTDIEGTYTLDSAKKVCESLVAFGKSDWFLPNQAALGAIRDEKDKIGGFADAYYWSSTDYRYYDNKCYYTVCFKEHEINYTHVQDKNLTLHVRCVRKH